MKPLVTIAIPTYERINYLKVAVSSALAQTYQNIEVLVGDDGNTLSIREWCEQQSQMYPKIRYQKNPHNLGLAGNFNALADSAKGEYLIIIGDDDRLLPDFIRKCVDAILPDGALAFSNHYIIDHNGKLLAEETRKWTEHYGRDRLSTGWLFDSEACVWRNSVPMSASLMRTADVRRLRFKEDLNNPDIEFFARLANDGGKFVFLPDYLAEYRIHPQSATSTGLKSERLVEYLIDIPVRPENERIKAGFLAIQMINAVSRCLMAGDQRRAKRLFFNSYYPATERSRLRGLVQRLSIGIPQPVGCYLYKTIQRLKSSCG
jgi:glycosyltransferase involved in cell wall biosynthesis